MKTFFSDTLPLNARVSVDFLKKDVKFDYPNKPNPFNSYLSVVDTINKGWMPSFWLFIVLFIYGGWQLGSDVNVRNLVGFLLFMWKGVPFLMALVLIFNKRYIQKWFPLCSYRARQMMGEHKFYLDVTPDMVKRGIFVLPLFKNVILEYDIKGTMADCIERIEVVENDFHYKSRLMQFLEKRQEKLWKATFYFNKKIKNATGMMQLSFI